VVPPNLGFVTEVAMLAGSRPVYPVDRALLRSGVEEEM